MAMVRNDDGPERKLNDFDLTAPFHLPCDLVTKRKTSKGDSYAHATISKSTVEVSSTSTSEKTL